MIRTRSLIYFFLEKISVIFQCFGGNIGIPLFRFLLRDVPDPGKFGNGSGDRFAADIDR